MQSGRHYHGGLEADEVEPLAQAACADGVTTLLTSCSGVHRLQGPTHPSQGLMELLQCSMSWLVPVQPLLVLVSAFDIAARFPLWM